MFVCNKFQKTRSLEKCQISEERDSGTTRQSTMKEMRKGFKSDRILAEKGDTARRTNQLGPTFCTQSLDSQLLENKIYYLNKPCEVEAIKAKVPDPKFFAFIPSLNKPTEEPHEKEIGDMKKNDVV